MNRANALLLSALFLCAAGATAGEKRPAISVAEAVAAVRADLDAAAKRLVETRERVARERSDAQIRLAALEDDVAGLRETWRRHARIADNADSRLRDLRDENARWREDLDAAWQTLVETRRNTETHFSLLDEREFADALNRLDERLATDRNAAQADEATPLVLSLLRDHVRALTQVRRRTGSAIDAAGREWRGEFARIGGVGTVFAAADAPEVSGLVRAESGSAEPHVWSCPDAADREAIRVFVRGGEALLPVDLTAGAALRAERAGRTLLEELRAGGPVMVPILALAVVCLLVALGKTVRLYRIPICSESEAQAFVGMLAEDRGKAETLAAQTPGSLGRLLRQAARHAGGSRDHVEEILHETILAETPDLESKLGILSVGAGVAPLLGLLGTVTGMIHTFRLISVFGSGDARMLSGGISEALITTEAGLTVAIPLLLIHAVLSRRARAISAGLEQAALAILNANGLFRPPGGTAK